MSEASGFTILLPGGTSISGSQEVSIPASLLAGRPAFTVGGRYAQFDAVAA